MKTLSKILLGAGLALSPIPSIKSQDLASYQSEQTSGSERVYHIAPQMAPTIDYITIDSALLDTHAVTEARRFLIHPGEYGSLSDRLEPESNTTFVGLGDSLVKDRYEDKIDEPTTGTIINGFVLVNDRENVSFVNLKFKGHPSDPTLLGIGTSNNILFYNNWFSGNPDGSGFPSQGPASNLSTVTYINNVIANFRRLDIANNGIGLFASDNGTGTHPVHLYNNIFFGNGTAIEGSASSIIMGDDNKAVGRPGNNYFVNNVRRNMYLYNPKEDQLAQGNSWGDVLINDPLINVNEDLTTIFNTKPIDEPLLPISEVPTTIQAEGYDLILGKSKSNKIGNDLFLFPANPYDPLQRIGEIHNSLKSNWEMYE